MERIDPACLAEKMACGPRVESVFGKRVLAREQLESIFVDLHHKRVLAATYCAVARGQFREVGFDLELDRTAMASANVLLHWPVYHAIEPGRGAGLSCN